MAGGEARTETASVLFTDLVGSTKQRQALGEETADRLHGQHLVDLENAVVAADGRVVKSLGDGIFAVFTSAADAVACAVSVQRVVHGHNRQNPTEPLSMRTGISVGDVVFEGEDCSGSAVVEAARLCAEAQGGQILVADLVRALTRGRGGFTFESVGELPLKGLDAPVPACYVVWTPTTAPVDQVPFPPLLAPTTQAAYAGRPELVADLHAGWKRSLTEGPQTVLLVGEPGVGKTRSAAEVARVAHEAGALVLYGRCDEELRLSYEPFVEALDWHTQHQPAANLGRFAGDLRRLVPDLEVRVAGLPAAIQSDARTEEHRLFEAVAGWLAEASRDRGLVLVVDDLHWATRPTLQMLLHVVRSLASDPACRLLLVATYRDTDVDRQHPLSDSIADMRRLPHVQRLPVAPLTADEVVELIEDLAGHELDESILSLARRTHAETDGNPFFLSEVLRHLIETGAVVLTDGRWTLVEERVEVPEGVRDVVGRRLNRLSAEANEVLGMAAVIGRDFHLDVLTEVAGVDQDTVLDALDEALRSRLVEEAGRDLFRFAHALTRQTLYEEPSSTRLRRMHRKIVQALLVLRPDDVAARAHHAIESGPTGDDLLPALDWVLQAGESSLAARAIGDAGVWFDAAAELLRDAEEVPAALGIRARLGEAKMLAHQGDPSFRELLLVLTRDAIDAGEIDLAAEAALANSRIINSVVGGLDTERIELVQGVLDAIGDAPHPAKALLLAAYVAEVSTSPAHYDLRLAMADEAVAMAEAQGDPAILARVLVATGNAVNVPERFPSIHARCVRALEAATEARDPNLQAMAGVQLGFVLYVKGDIEGSRRVLGDAARLAEAEASPTIRWMVDCFNVQFPLWDGDPVATREANDALLQVGLELGEPDALPWWGGVTIGLHWVDGTFGEDVDFYASMIPEFPDIAGWRLSHAAALLERGDVEAARAACEESVLLGPDAVGRDFFTFATWSIQAWLIHHLGTADDAEALLPRVEPYADLWGTNGVIGYHQIAFNVALLLAKVGRTEAAVTMAKAAWDRAQTIGMRGHEPMAARFCATTLLAVGTPEARRDAADLLGEAITTSSALDFPSMTSILEGLLTEARS